MTVSLFAIAADFRASAAQLADLDRRAELARAERYMAERDAARAELDRAREVLREAREMLIGDPHLYRGQCPQPNDTDARDPECPACATLVRIDAALTAKGE